MSVDAQLIAAREDYDKGVTNDAGFTSAVNTILANAVSSMSDAEKLSAFDAMAPLIVRRFEIHDLDGGTQYQRSDTYNLMGEAAVMAVLGPMAFEFINKTYEQG